MIVEISDQRLKTRGCLLENGWKKQSIWLGLSVGWMSVPGKILLACSHKIKNKVDVVFQLNGMFK